MSMAILGAYSFHIIFHDYTIPKLDSKLNKGFIMEPTAARCERLSPDLIMCFGGISAVSAKVYI